MEDPYDRAARAAVHAARLRDAEAEALRRIAALEAGHRSFDRDAAPFLLRYGPERRRGEEAHRERMAALRAPELDRWRRKLGRIRAALRNAEARARPP